MKITVVALALLTVAGSGIAQAQPGGRSGGSIPAQFHGRWAQNQAACRTEHFTTVITINRRGWSSFEEGGHVTRVGQVRRGTHHFRVANFAGANETMGSIAMRREGARLIMSFDDDNDAPVHYTLIRCRR
jgi:hypothetical protein